MLSMKKVVVLIIAFIYLAEVSGMSVYKHYCMDRLVSWGWTKGGRHCPSCGMEKEPPEKKLCNRCCKDEYKIVKLTGDHKTAVFNWQPSQFTEADKLFYTTGIFSPLPATAAAWSNIHAPPLKHKVPFYLFNCVFRI